MLDHDGDENYQPMQIPLDGGFPEPVFEDFFKNHRVRLTNCGIEKNIAYFIAEKRDKPVHETYRGNLVTNKLEKLVESEWGGWPGSPNDDHSIILITEGYTLAIQFYLCMKKKNLD